MGGYPSSGMKGIPHLRYCGIVEIAIKENGEIDPHVMMESGVVHG
jgi:hypothetical protein